MYNNRAPIDARKAHTGKDGLLLDGNGTILSTVESFQTQVNLSNAKYRPLGTMQDIEVPESYGTTLTLTEYVVSDATLLRKLLSGLKTGMIPQFVFQGTIRGDNGEEERIIYRNCVPSGTIDLQNVASGDLIKRAWSFAVNDTPDAQKTFK